MRIFALDFEPSSRRGGQELSLVDECVGLAARGHDVRLGFVKPGDLLERYRAAGIATVPLSEIEVRPNRRLRSAADFGRSVLRAAATRSDVICVNQYHDTLFGALVSRLARAPLVCHLRLLPPGSLCSQWRLGLPSVTRFVAASRAIADAWIALRGVDPETVQVAHDGIDMEYYRPRSNRDAIRRELGVSANAFLVMYVGRVDHAKNLERLLEAFALLSRDVPDSNLAIAGRPVNHESASAGEAYLASLRSHAAALGIEDRVRWLGARPDVPELLSAADVSALFTLEEGLGRVTFESLACGVPAIASTRGGAVEILTGEFERYQFDPRDPADAAEKLRSLVGWRERDPRLGERARAHAVANFSLDAKVSQLEIALQRARTAGPQRNGPRGEQLRAVFPEPV